MLGDVPGFAVQRPVEQGGVCQSHIAAPWRRVAATGSRAGATAPAAATGRRASRRSGRGRPQSEHRAGADEARSKAATSMISSCSIMCIVKLRSPAAWSGEASDAGEHQPAGQKQSRAAPASSRASTAAASRPGDQRRAPAGRSQRVGRPAFAPSAVAMAAAGSAETGARGEPFHSKHLGMIRPQTWQDDRDGEDRRQQRHDCDEAACRRLVPPRRRPRSRARRAIRASATRVPRKATHGLPPRQSWKTESEPN